LSSPRADPFGRRGEELRARRARRCDEAPVRVSAAPPAADLLRTCLTAASLADGPARELIARTAREAFESVTQKPARPAGRRRAA
jgi:hypothetical protein